MVPDMSNIAIGMACLCKRRACVLCIAVTQCCKQMLIEVYNIQLLWYQDELNSNRSAALHVYGKLWLLCIDATH